MQDKQLKLTPLSWADVRLHVADCDELFWQPNLIPLSDARQMGYRFIKMFGGDPVCNLIFCKEVHRMFS